MSEKGDKHRENAEGLRDKAKKEDNAAAKADAADQANKEAEKAADEAKG
jgi:hypothetical protein